MSTEQEPTPISFNIRIIQHKNDPTAGQTPQEIGIDSCGKEVKAASWKTLGAFIGSGETSMKKDDLLKMIPLYEINAYGTAEEQTSNPRDIWLCDHKELGHKSPYKTSGWQPVTISVEPNERKKHEKWKTKKRVLDIEEMETEQCPLWDPTVDFYKPKIVSEFKRSSNPVFGKGFAPPVTFEFRGFPDALGLCCLAKDDKTPERRTIEWVLHKFDNASAGDHCVDAIKHTIRGKLKYEVHISGVAAGDCRTDKLSNPRYRQFPVDFVLQHNGIEPTTAMSEEIELVYYTHIHVTKIG